MLMISNVTTFLAGLPGEVWTALAMVATGALTWWVSRRKTIADIDRADKQSYRDELRELKARLDKVEEEVTQWRARYYREQEYAIRLRLQLLEAGHEPEKKDMSFEPPPRHS